MLFVPVANFVLSKLVEPIRTKGTGMGTIFTYERHFKSTSCTLCLSHTVPSTGVGSGQTRRLQS